MQALFYIKIYLATGIIVSTLLFLFMCSPSPLLKEIIEPDAELDLLKLDLIRNKVSYGLRFLICSTIIWPLGLIVLVLASFLWFFQE